MGAASSASDRPSPAWFAFWAVALLLGGALFVRDFLATEGLSIAG